MVNSMIKDAHIIYSRMFRYWPGINLNSPCALLDTTVLDSTSPQWTFERPDRG